jgi:CHAT domain-containing protein/ATP/maltotriose-dependent transcriptional regulator MalT
MRSQRLGLTALITLLTAATTSFVPNFLALFPTSLVLAQTPADYKAQGELPRLPTEDEIRQDPGIRKIEEQFEDGIRKYEEQRQRWQQDILQSPNSSPFFLIPNGEVDRPRQRGIQQSPNSSPVQIPNARKAEADRLAQQGLQQLNTSQFKAALQSWQKALAVYREIKDRRGESAVLGGLGLAYYSLGDYAEAIEYSQQYLPLMRELKDREGEGTALGLLGLAYAALNNYAKAIEYNEQRLVLMRELKNRPGEGEALVNLGGAYLNLGNYPKAIEYNEQSLVMARELNNRLVEGSALVNLGGAYVYQGNYPKAIEYSQQGLAMARELNNRLVEGSALVNLGSVYLYQGNYVKAIEYNEQSLAVARELNNRQGEGTALVNLGSVYLHLGNYSKAIEYSQQSLAVAKSIKDRRVEGTALLNLGSVYLYQGNYAKAIEYNEQSLTIARELKNSQMKGAVLVNLGFASFNLGDYPKAIEYSQQSLAIARDLKDRRVEGAALVNLGSAYNALGNYAKAIGYSQQGLAITQQVNNRPVESIALGSLGHTYLNVGDYPKTIEYNKRSLAITREIKDRRGERMALGLLGLAYFRLKDYTRAIDYQQQSLAIAREIKERQGEAQALGNLGIAYLYQDDYTKAVDYLQQSLAIARDLKDRQGEGIALVNLGSAYFNLENYAKTIEYAQQGLTIAQEIKNPLIEGIALNNLGGVFLKEAKFAEAHRTLGAAIKMQESLRAGLGSNDANKVSIFETQRNSYPLLQRILIAQNKANAALEIAERGRARAFVELLARQLDFNQTEQYTITPPTLSQIKQIAKAQNATLVEYSIIPDDFKIQGKLQERESELFIWIIKPTGEVAFRQIDLKPLWQQQKKSLKDLVAKARESITQGVRIRGTSNKLTFSPGDLVRLNNDEPNWAPWQVVAVNAQSGTLKLKQPSFEEGITIERSQADVVEKVTSFYTKNPHLQQLHQLLIQPITDLLPTDPNSRVVFIPQDSLFLVPFPALQDASGKYLIEQHTITTAPAIQVLDLTHRQRQRVSGSGKDALVVGNPIMPKVSLEPGQEPQQLESLPHAEQEAIEIAQLLQTKAITDRQANEAAIVQQLPKAQLIHLATHGILDEIRGLGSAIALAPSGTDDGLLTAEEILDLQLQAELVVLSACDTGQGRITGDGIIGLSRSLFAAGVPSVIVSLWSVPDAPTAPLMKEFYQQLQSNPDKAQALRSAMLKTMKKHPDPRDWAAFTLIGEAQ